MSLLPDDSDLERRMRAEGLKPARWSNGPDAVYGMHDHPYGKILVVESGSITFTLGAEKRVVELKRGDRLEVPPRTPHSAVVGAEGVVCLEAHVRPKRSG